MRSAHTISATARLFRSMANEGRLTVLDALADDALHVTELAERTQRPQPTVSTHLAALHAEGLVRREPDGRQVRYRLADPSVRRLLEAAEQTVLAATDRSYVCTQPCCIAVTG